MKIAYYLRYFIRRLSVKGKHSFYSAGYKVLYPECLRHGMTPWQHYVIDGKRKGFDNGNHPSAEAFFPEGYEFEYPDVKASGMDPWKHYAEHGHAEGRDNGLHPKNDEFFAEGYLLMYPDVAQRGEDPWKHYVLNGKNEGRDNGFHPRDEQFFAEGYLLMYPDVAQRGEDPWKHYVMNGRKEGRDSGLHPNADLFFAEGYLLNHPDVKASGTNPWLHYMLYGRNLWQRSPMEDYRIRLDGHEQEIVRAVYLTHHEAERNARKKVLLLGHSFSVQGAPLSLQSIARILVSEGYHVDIAVRDEGNISPVHMYDGLGADVFMLPNSTDVFPGAGNVIAGYDLVIVNTIVMGAYADLCRKLNVPHLWFIREDLPSLRYYFDFIKTCRQYFFDDCENILCVSKYVTDCLYNAYNIKLRYINNFIEDVMPADDAADRQEKTGTGAGKPRTFAVVGNVQDRKAQQSVVAAFLAISGNPAYQNRWKLCFIGQFSTDSKGFCLGKKLEATTKNVPEIVWCGEVTENKWELFRSIDFFIVPSLEESSSRVAIESAMLGKPVIVTSHVGAKYLTADGAGFVYEPGDTATLRDIAEKCIDMPEDEYRKMSRQARHNYENTSTPEVYHKALSSIINNTFEKARSKFIQIPNDGLSLTSFRALSTGKNAFFYNKSNKVRFEYISFADFDGSAAQSSNTQASQEKNAAPATGIVVPVFNGLEHLKVLIPSLFKNTDLPHKFIFVDDCSDAETADFLKEAISGRDDCTLLKNEKNLGFVQSTNRGAEKALESCGNFVMLNQDTEVPSGWLSRLMKPIFEDETISSVTPLSNACNIFSFPFFGKREKNHDFLRKFGLEGINQAIRSSAVSGCIDIPTGHGFCMAISGKVWRKIGGLNAALFGRGYGEENEWSQRAELDGYRNVLATSLFVAHHHYDRGSFTNEERKTNISSALQIISVMFPSYESRVQDFLREYPSAGAIASIYLSLARQQGYKAEIFTEPSPFLDRLSGDDGIFVLKAKSITKLAVRLLGETILVGNARNLDSTGIFDA